MEPQPLLGSVCASLGVGLGNYTSETRTPSPTARTCCSTGSIGVSDGSRLASTNCSPSVDRLSIRSISRLVRRRLSRLSPWHRELAQSMDGHAALRCCRPHMPLFSLDLRPSLVIFLTATLAGDAIGAPAKGRRATRAERRQRRCFPFPGRGSFVGSAHVRPKLVSPHAGASEANVILRNARINARSPARRPGAGKGGIGAALRRRRSANWNWSSTLRRRP